MTQGKKEPLVRRLWSRTRFDVNGCFLWTGGLDGQFGYGQIKPDGPQGQSPLKTHVAAWLVTYGEIPVGLHVCHKCDNPRCVRPDHLFLGTAKDNIRDAAKKGRLARKLTAEDIVAIRNSSLGKIRLGKQYGVAYSLITRIRQRKAWAHVP